MNKILIMTLMALVLPKLASAQEQEFTKADSLRGALTPLRTAYDVQLYDLDVELDIPNKSISGTNTIVFEAVEDFAKIQIDLYENMKINSIKHGDATLPFEREFNAVFVSMDKTVKKGDVDSITVDYEGVPMEAIRPPWESGFTWATDSLGQPWITVTSEGEGASLWWPNKDHLSDEPDNGVKVAITVPEDLKAVSNGRLVGKDSLENNRVKYHWRNIAPINNYNVALYVGDYVKYREFYSPRPQVFSNNSPRNERTLDLDYYVLSYNLDKAKEHFDFTDHMLTVFESLFGPYPFYEDGFKIVETSHLGMEHQSAIAYGNDFQNGWAGVLSVPYIEFDYLFVHESGHEWWGNNVTATDIADMWIHESFTTYADAIYVFASYGFQGYKDYLKHYKTLVTNEKPIIGEYDVNDHKRPLDIYYKGALMLNTISQLVESNSDWFKAFQKVQQEYAAPKTISTEELVLFLEKELGMDLKLIFDQYLTTTNIPVLNMRLIKEGKDHYAVYRWENVVEGFDMPVKMKIGQYKDKWIYPTEKWKKAKLPKGYSEEHLGVDTDVFYIDLYLEK